MNPADNYSIYSGSVIPQKHKYSRINEFLKAEVESIISTLADRRSIPALIDLLDDIEPDIRWIAAEGLIRIGRRSIIPLLHTISEGKQFIYPDKVRHVLLSLLTRREKRDLRELLLCLAETGSGNAVSEASAALKGSIRFIN